MKKLLSFLCLILILISVPLKNAYAYDVARLYGDNRYGTSAAITSQFSHASSVILATGENYADALCAVPLAKNLNAPILLTETNSLNSNAKSELHRLSPENIIIVGGTSAISKNVETTINSMNIPVQRISGNTRYETSLEVAKFLGTESGLFVATGDNFADALSVGPIAANLSMPIILTNRDNVCDSVINYISTNEIPVSYVIGGCSAISDNVANNLKNSKRISGTDRYDTNRVLVNTFYSSIDFSTVYVATGRNYPDALSGGALAAKYNNPIVLTAPYPGPPTLNIINYNSVNKIILLGGRSVMSDTTANVLSFDGIIPSEKFINVPYISQKNVLPTGCELVSTVMTLNYYDYSISLNEFIDNHVPINNIYRDKGILYGPTPNSSFVGNPRSSNGFGCYPPVIVNSLNEVLTGYQTARDTTGNSIYNLIEKYIVNDIPVIFWATINLIPSRTGPSWYVTGSNERFTWINNEHCMVLVGYDQNYYYFNDPYNSNGIKGYDRSLVEKRFSELGMRSVAIEG